MSLSASGLQPTAGINQASSNLDAEKNVPIVGHSGSQDAISNTDSDTNECDIDGEKVQEFQKGVERVRIITSIWSKPTLISMLAL